MASGEWSVVWQAVGAISLALMALMQIGAALAVLKVVRQAQVTIDNVSAQIAPLTAKGAAVLDSAQALVHQGQGLVHQAQGVVSEASAQVAKLHGTVDAVAQGLATVRHRAERVTRQGAGLVAGARAMWSVIRGQGRRPYPSAASWEQME